MQLGDYRVEIIQDTEFRLDGGAMFGVVPRKLWAKECPPDDENRIRMNMNCVFIDTGSEKILIETGIGDKWSAKQQSMYGIDRARPLTETLKTRAGVSADEITIVVNTHLHFDHAGGNTSLNAEGIPVATFPNAVTSSPVRSWTTQINQLNAIARAIYRRTGDRWSNQVSLNQETTITKLCRV